MFGNDKDISKVLPIGSEESCCKMMKGLNIHNNAYSMLWMKQNRKINKKNVNNVNDINYSIPTNKGEKGFKLKLNRNSQTK